MAQPFTITAKLLEAGKAAGGLDGLIARCGDLSRPLGRLGQHHQKKAQRILQSGERGVWAHNAAGLKQSMTYAVTPPNHLAVGSNKPYARVQQFGGRVESSRPGGFLAIPIADNIIARGNAKFQSPREVSDGEFFRAKDGRLYFRRPLPGRKRIPKRGKRGKRLHGLAAQTVFEADEAGYELLFLLVPAVNIPAHRYVTHDPEDQREWERYAQDWLLRGR